MKCVKYRIIALVLAVAVLLTGCALDFGGYFARLGRMFTPVTFENMTYTRPDLDLLDEALADCLESARGNDLDQLVGHINTLNSICNSFQTNYSLAYIHYSIDLTDSYWETEYHYCAQLSTRVQAAVDELMYALADSELRDELETEEYFGQGYFDGYDGESLWTEEFSALMEQETELINQYYELSSLAVVLDPQSEAFFTTYGGQMEELYAKLVKLRQQIAAEAGYDTYAEFAYEFYYQRDYTPAQIKDYLGQIRTELVPLYMELGSSDVWSTGTDYSSEERTFQYVKDMAHAMGGTVSEAFDVMEQGGLYHISYGENKYGASFEVFLPEYMVPFVFMNPTMSRYDQLTFAHEFGHFCNDYASGGTVVGIDVGEFFSQGMEYLSLCYAEDGEELARLKLADSLCVYVEQASLADFESRVYRMSPEELTAENIRVLYGQVAEEYGFGDYVDSRSYVSVTHLFTSPMYVISYVVSNDAAMQLYQMELNESGSGLSCYMSNLATQQGDFLTFVQEAGLKSPFDAGHIQSVKKIFEDVL